MVLALLLSLSLVFSSAQVYKVYSVCATCQNVADACALAAENQVASFYTVAQACDAVSLSLCLTGCTLAGVGLVASCIPPAAGAAQALLQASKSVFGAQRSFARQAKSGLDTLQKLLPFLACAQAAAIASQNDSGHSTYLGLAVLLPLQGQSVASPELDTHDFDQQVENEQPAIAQAAERSSQAQQQADEAKRRAWMHDCGNSPAYCLHERAQTLAGMQGAENPFYASPDTWSFGVALARAQAYYPRRLALEQPVNDSVEEITASTLRARFYAYACDQMGTAYVSDTDAGFAAYFPLLPRNTEQMRATWLYTEDAYPVYSDEEGGMLMHAYGQCPGAQECSFEFMASIQWWESSQLEKCEHCQMSASRMGKVAQASTSIDNGFEYHYLAIANEAASYQGLRLEADAQGQAARQPFEGLLGQLRELAQRSAQARISVQPPGSDGAIALVVDVRGVDAASIAPSSFVGTAGSLGTRAAVSAATLAPDDPTEADNVIAQLADGLLARLSPQEGGAHGVVVGIWGRALFAFNTGRQAVLDAVRDGLDGLPLVGAFGLGSWAAGKLESALDEWGLSPIDLAAYKPVVVNSYHVAAAQGSAVAQGWVDAKRLYGSSGGSGTGNPLAVLVGIAGSALANRVRDEGEDFVVATIDVFGEGDEDAQISIGLPPQVVERGAGAVEDAGLAVQDFIEQNAGGRPWR